MIIETDIRRPFSEGETREVVLAKLISLLMSCCRNSSYRSPAGSLLVGSHILRFDQLFNQLEEARKSRCACIHRRWSMEAPNLRDRFYSVYQHCSKTSYWWSGRRNKPCVMRSTSCMPAPYWVLVKCIASWYASGSKRSLECGDRRYQWPQECVTLYFF